MYTRQTKIAQISYSTMSTECVGVTFICAQGHIYHETKKMESLTSLIVINRYCLLATCQVFIVVIVSWEIKYARLMISSHEKGPH